ncbi:class I adenylate-forming enzyme family protein [Actinophytocola oryzae]|uniref:Bile acid-coenzyme A ligase n=1 Tax=Actinophytocola oryzae TaxID=502181 RepID=A0A4R7VKM8_9PSEU|nr:AMP-binding protein [Actinophytocola oryzae]TDV49709.1 bile acid-coenzyme A ligase [Actinophytocola oryzae]
MTSLPSVQQRICDLARDEPARTALVGFDAELTEQTLSWRELGGLVEETASVLRALPGSSCVVVEAANTLRAATSIVSALAAEVPVFPLNPATPAAERTILLRQLGRRFARIHLLPPDGRPERVDLPPGSPDDRTAAYLLATGGSTGVPKIAVRPGPLRYDAARTPSLPIRQTGWRSGQRQLIVGPLFHAAPFTTLIDSVLDRNIVVLQPFFSPQWTVELVARYAVEWMQLTPTHMREILLLARPEQSGMASLRAVLHTAARCDPETKRGWIDLLGPERLFELYGATEGIGMTLSRGDEWLARPGTVGRGFLTQLRVVDGEGRPVPPGTVGTVYMRTAQTGGRSAYVGDQVVRTTPDGFATVGDRGRLDEKGYLFLQNRGDDLINVGGEKVDPNEVEAALLDHPDVLDVVALGVPHDTLGSVIGVRVVLRPASTVHRVDLAAHCGRRLAGYKIPKQFTFVDRIPRSAAGKIQRWRLDTAGIRQD